MSAGTTPTWMRTRVADLESTEALDAAVDQFSAIGQKVPAGARRVLRGEWLGHALHPVLTDLPLGCWMSSTLLDLLGGKRARPAAQRLVGLGLLFVPPTAASGLVDWSELEERRSQRVGVAHAAGNVVVSVLHLCSWRARRKGHHARGVVLSLTGNGIGVATAYLGGHLSFARGAGVGPRGLFDDGAVGRTGDSVAAASEPLGDLIDAAAAAEILGVQEDQVHAMVDGDLLVPEVGSGGSARFTRASVLAAREVGG